MSISSIFLFFVYKCCQADINDAATGDGNKRWSASLHREELEAVELMLREMVKASEREQEQKDAQAEAQGKY